MMKLSMPIKYILDENSTRIIDKDLWKAICFDLNCVSEGNDFVERNDIASDTLLDFMHERFPDGEHDLEHGILEIRVWDYYDYSFYSTMNYCVENNIPLDTIETPDCSDECKYCKFYRPGFNGTKVVDMNDDNEPVVSIPLIQEIMNAADETKTDTDIMFDINKRLEEMSPYSELNRLSNWI